MASSLREKTINGVVWSGVERFSTQGITFLFNILIARLLLPEDYGVVAMLNIFIAVAQTFIDSGFGQALVRKQNRTEEDFNTVFYFNLAVSTFFFILLWICAPLIASFYNTPVLVKITRIISFNLIINSFGAIPSAHLTIEIDFRSRAIISIVRCVVIGAVGLIMAFKGYGIWALVAQNIVGSILSTVLLCLFVRWVPKLIFSWKSFKEMFSFGSKLLGTSLIDTIWGNLYTLVIGKAFSPASLGVYNRAESFATFPSANIFGMINSVIFPSLCRVQNDTERLRSCYAQFIKLTTFIVFPLMIGLASVADPFIRLILTDNWSGAIPLLQILCFSLILYPLNAINITFPNVLGHSEMYLKSVMLNKVVELACLIIAIPFGLKAMCFGKVAASIITLFINTFYTKMLIDYGIVEQAKDLVIIVLNALIMGVIVYFSTSLINNMLVKLISGILIGGGYYLISSALLRIEEFNTLKEIVLTKLSIRK